MQFSSFDKSSTDPEQHAESAAAEAVVFPASFSQQRLWFLDQLEPGTALYNIPSALRLTGRLDVAALRRTLDEIVARHEALRTTFAMYGSELMQLIKPPRALDMPVISLEDLPEERREDKAQELARQEAQRPFDLARGPLLRAQLLRLSGEEHVLLLTMHHVVSDGWSMSVLFNELSKLYAAYSRGEESPLEELPIQYADYAEWLRNELSGEKLEEQVGYWREHLAGGRLPVLELGIRKGVAGARHTGRTERLEISAELREKLQRRSRAEGVTLFMLLFAAWDVLLYRYSGEREVVVGTPIANRTRAEVEGLIGFFINTLVLRVTVDPEKSFGELLRQVKEVTLGAYAHQEMPFEKLVEVLQPERSVDHSPLFQVMFMLQNAPKAVIHLEGLTIEGIPIDIDLAKSELSLGVVELDEGMRAVLEYETDLFDADAIRRMLAHYRTILEAVADNPERRVWELPLLTPDERRQLLVEWNDTACDYSLNRCMHQLFEEQVARTPDSTAVIFESQELSYAELNRRADRLAAYLRRKGVGPESLVGIMMERSVEMVVSLLGVLKAGGAYVPLDPGYPAERLAFMVADAGVKVLLTQQGLVEHLPPHEAEVVRLDEEGRVVGAAESESEPAAPTADVDVNHTAYIIYTSGSTGRPKGVVTSHRAMCNLVMWMQHRFNLTQSDRMLQKTPFSFDASIWEFFWPLISGATLVVARPGGHRDPEYMVEVMRDRKVTILQSVPSLMQVLVEQEKFAECRDLREVFCGGEAFPASLRDRFFERMNGVNINNVYGPTEAAMHVTHLPVDRSNKGSVIPIGRPIGNTQLYVLDTALGPVPVGVSGELYIGGVQLARGYWKRPGLTAERFVPDPFSARRGARLYRTGDLARHLPDGAVEFLGRADDQVKIRGFRIELGEVESVLAEHEGVTACVVVAQGEGEGQKRLVAYVAAAGGVTGAELRRHVGTRVPEYMVPSQVVVLDELPLTASGKVDKRALPRPEEVEGAGAAGVLYEAPRTEVEESLAEIWRGVLKAERVGIDDNFFELGGHSLMATQIISQIRKQLGVEVALRKLFEQPTIRGLAEEVEKAKAAGESASASKPIRRASREGRRFTNLPRED